MSQLLIVSSDNNLIHHCDPLDAEYALMPNLIKGWLREHRGGVILIDERDCDYEQFVGLLRYARQVMKNQRQVFWWVSNGAFEYPSESSLLPDRVLDTQDLSTPFWRFELQNVLERQQAHQHVIDERDQQIALMTKINQFNKRDLNLNAALTTFIFSLDNYFSAHQTWLIKDSAEQTVPNFYRKKGDKLIRDPAAQPAIWAISEKMKEVTRPNVLLAEKDLPYHSLFFPVMVLGKRICSIVCLVEEAQSDSFSIARVKVIEEAAEQLRVSLENIEAQRQMRSHYARLKRSLAELQVAKEHALHNEKMVTVGRIAAGLAHEINNPLSIVLGNFSSLNQYIDEMIKLIELHDEFMGNLNNDSWQQSVSSYSQYRSDNDIAFMVDDLSALILDSKTSLLRVKDVVADLRVFSDEKPAEFGDVELDRVCHSVINMLKLAHSNQIDITSSVPVGMLVRVNKSLVEKAIYNVLENAMEAAQLTQGKVIMSAQEVASAVELIITDTGPGMDEETLKHAFEPFFTTKKVGAGSGMGLTVTKAMLQRMGASITLNSLNDGGCQVVIQFVKDENQSA